MSLGEHTFGRSKVILSQKHCLHFSNNLGIQIWTNLVFELNKSRKHIFTVKDRWHSRNSLGIGREPWSSGQGRRLMFQRSWVRIPLYFFTYICCKNFNGVCLKRPKINNWRGRGWPIFWRKTLGIRQVFHDTEILADCICSTSAHLSFANLTFVVKAHQEDP